jgi:hypothetical protein
MMKKDRRKTMEREVWEGILGREGWFLYLRDALGNYGIKRTKHWCF